MKFLSVLLTVALLTQASYATEFGPPDSVLVTPHGGGRAQMGQVDLSQANAVKNVLPATLGGTAATSIAQAFINFWNTVSCAVGGMLVPGSSGPQCIAAGTTNFIWTSNGSGVLPGWKPAATTPIAPTITTVTSEGISTTGTLSASSVCVNSPGTLQGLNIGAGVIDSTQSAAIPAGTAIAGLPGTCSAGQIQLNQMPTPTNVGDSLNFSVSTTGSVALTAECITALGSLTGISVGAIVADTTNPGAIPGGTTVSAIPGTCSTGQIQMSANALSTQTGDTFVFSFTTTGTLSTASACVASPGSLTGLAVGQVIADTTNPSVITSGTTIAGLPGTCSSGQIQMSANAIPLNTGDSLIFGSEPNTSGTLSTLSPCITSVGSLAGIVVGAPVYDASNPAAFAANAVVTAIPGTCSSGQIQMSTNALANDGSDSLYFGGVYYAPLNPAPLYLEVEQVGGGGGGGAGDGNGGSGGGAGGTGLTTTFNVSLLMATGGGGGAYHSNGGGGGTASVNLPAIQIIALQGAPGTGPVGGNGAATVRVSGGPGGSSPFGGAGNGVLSSGGSSASPTTGSGGGGGGQVSGGNTGGAGGAGGYLKALIPSPALSYPYFVGFGGDGGGGGFPGGAGGSSHITIWARSQ